MIIVKHNKENIIVGRDIKAAIAAFRFNSWNGTLDTVLVIAAATAHETELLRKIAYQYAENIGNGSRNGNMRDKAFITFQECFDAYHINPDKELANDYHFRHEGCKFIKNAYDTEQAAVDAIITKVKDVSGVSISIDISESGNVFERSVYSVSVDQKGKEFTFWNSNEWPDKEESSWALHIVPGYHPSSPTQGRKPRSISINGSTDALIRSTTIASVYSPKESRQKNESFGRSWNYMKHPCKATGKSFQFTLHGHYHATKELVDDAIELILSALGTHPEGKYVGVIGGFIATYDFPENIANRTGKPLPSKRQTRGSERHCMWTYDVLTKENELDKAYIPEWFHDEKWVEFFKGEKGIFPVFK